MIQVTQKQKEEAIAHFQFEGTLIKQESYGSGHINDTFLLTFEAKGKEKKKEKNVILQRINTEIFSDPIGLMENIVGVTSYLRRRIIEEGGDPDRETLNIIPTIDGRDYFLDSKGDYWRSYIFITNAASYDKVEQPEYFYQSAVAFGHFQCMLADYPAETLHETIAGFHDTKARFAAFKKVVQEDVLKRAASVQKEIQFVLGHEDVANYFSDLLAAG